MNQQNSQIGFIGGGNMVRSIIGGLINVGWDPAHINVFDPDDGICSMLTVHFSVNCLQSNSEVVASSNVIVLAVKPQVVSTALKPLTTILKTKSPLLISIVAGLRLEQLVNLSSIDTIIRVMPNTPALVSSGVSGLFAGKSVSVQQKQMAESVMRSVGSIFWVENEALIDTITAVSGSGPAYFLLMIEALEKSAVDNGFDTDSARLLAIETALGAARLALESDTTPARLRQQVTSPGGTTEAAINKMESCGFSKIIQKGVTAAIERARELGVIIDS